MTRHGALPGASMSSLSHTPPPRNLRSNLGRRLFLVLPLLALLAGTLTVLDAAPAHAQAPTMEFELDTLLFLESQAPRPVKVQLSAALTQQTTVGIRVRASGTTAEPAEYTLSATTLTFAAGDTEKSFTFDAAADLRWEPDEVLYLELVPPAGAPYTLGTDSELEISIVDDSYGPPTSLSVTAGNARLELSWKAPAGTGFTGYDVHLTSASKTGSSPVADDAVLGDNVATAWVEVIRSGTITSQAITSLTNSTAYRVRVRATGGGGASSTWVFGTGTPSASVPAAPTALSVTNGDRRLILSWTAPTGSVTGYDVSYTTAPASGNGAVANGAVAVPAGGDAATAWVAVSRTGTTAAQTIPNLAIGTTYRVRVRAQYSTGAGAWVTGTGTPAKPVLTLAVATRSWAEGQNRSIISTIVPTLASASSVNLRVDPASTASSDDYTAATSNPLSADSSSDGFIVETNNDSVNEEHETLIVNLEAITNAPYTLGTQKTVTVTIQDNDPPAAPGLSLTGGGDGNLTARWSKPTGPVDRYELRYKESSAADQTATTPGDPSTGWVTSTSSGTSATITGLTDRTSYHVQVRANDGQTQTGNGWGEWSATQTGTPAHSNSPGAVRDFRAEPNNPGELRISWRSPSFSRGGALLGACCTDHELHYTTAAESAVADGEPASGTDPSTAWVKADFRRAIISGLTDGTEHRLRGRVHNAFGPGKWAHTTATPQAQLDATAPTVNVSRRYGLPLRLQWGQPTSATPQGYEAQFTSATTSAVANDAAPVAGTDPALGWVDVIRVGGWIYTFGNGHSQYTFPGGYAFKGGADYRFRVRAVYQRYGSRDFRPFNAYSNWGATAPDAHTSYTAVGLYGHIAYENRGSVPVRVNLASPVPIEVTVAYATSDRTARSDGTVEFGTLDYTPVSGTLTFKPGQTEQWIHVPIIDDWVGDSGEEFLVTLSNPQPSKYVALGCDCVAHHKTNRLETSWIVTIYNHEADLTALAVEGASDADGPYAPVEIGAFAPETTEYAITVAYDTTHARLTPTARRDNQKLRAGTGSNLQAVSSGAASAAIPLEVGQNTLVVESFLAGEERKIYTVAITRQEPVVPGPVGDLTLTAEGDRVVVSWAAPEIGSAPKGYIVHLKPDGGKAGSGKTRRPKAKKTQVTYDRLEAGVTYNVWVRAQNDAGKGGRVHSTITLNSARTTATAKANSAPTVASEIADVSGLRPDDARQVSLAGVFTDAERDTLTITANSSNDSVATTTLNDQSLTVTAKQAGTATITVTAADGRGGSVTDAFTVTVSPKPNSAPTVASALGDLSGLREGDARQVSLAGVFTDADDDTLTITANSSNDGVATATLNDQNLTVSAKQAGTATITVTAADGNGGSVSDAFSVTVSPKPKPNSAPTVAASLGALSGLRAGDTRQVSLAGVFTDADGDTLTITASSLNNAVATATVNGQNLTISAKQAGTATITVTAADDKGGSVTNAFSVTVEANAAPQPEPEPEQEATQEPEPEPEQEQGQETADASESDLPAIVQEYDQDRSGKIEQDEWASVIADYSAAKLTTPQIQELAKYRG